MLFPATVLLIAALFEQDNSGLKKISDGVFTSTQASRGKGGYDQYCSRCHNLALIGSERGPAIKGAGFLGNWENDSVGGLFIKIRDTMPQGNSGTVNEPEKLDILSYILQQNGFPAGNTELKLDIPSLQQIRVGKEVSGMPNFSLVEVVGCLSQGSDGRWSLMNAIEPNLVKDEAPAAAELAAAESKPLGTLRYDLVSVSASLKAESMKGHKVDVRGLLYRDAGYNEINLIFLQTLSTTCR